MKIKLRLSQAAIVFRFLMCRILSVFCCHKHWVIMERGTDARDNGYWIYEYIRGQHPEKKIYYVIDRDSPDYKKVKDHAVQYGSLKSIWLVASAEKLISTHYALCFPGMSSRLFRLLRLQKKFCFLQHGVIQNDHPYLYSCSAPMQLFICGAKPEYEYISSHFGHPDGVVQYTGLARFDQLHDFKTKRQILVMPTWRAYLRSSDEIIWSDYFKCWQSLLTNEQLLAELEADDLKLVFYPHYEMQPYIDCFKITSDRVILAKFEHYDVQTLLKESAVLVTDYSSVFFDFAYMKKPIVYYQFDEEMFFDQHYQKGYFDYRMMGFGDVCVDEQTVISSLLRICRNEMKTETKYLERINEFFPLQDKENCKRIYDFIANN